MYYSRSTLSEDLSEIKGLIKEMQEQINDLTSEIIDLKRVQAPKVSDGKTYNKLGIIDSRDFGDGLPFGEGDMSCNLGKYVRKPTPRIVMTRPEVIRRSKTMIETLLSGIENGRIVEFVQRGKFDGSSPQILAVLKERVDMNGHTFYNVIDSAISACHYKDDYHEDIGKAIALCKLLGRIIPDYLMNAPKIGEQYIKY